MARKLVLVSMIVIAMCIYFAPAGIAVEIRNGQSVDIPAGSTIPEDLAAAGQTVTVGGNIKGDSMIAGSGLTVTGATAGTSMLAGSNVNCSGTVGNDLFAAGGIVTIASPVADNAWLAGGSVAVSKTAHVGRDLMVAGGTVHLDSAVGRDLRAACSDLTVNGAVAGTAYISADTLTIGPNAVIHGDLVYSSPKQARISPGARILGRTLYTPVAPTPRHRAGGALGFLWLLSLMAAYATGAVLLAVVPRFMTGSADTAGRFFWKSLLVGFLALIVVPIACVILLTTVVGIPLSLILFALWLIAVYFAKIIAALAIGRLVFVSAHRPQTSNYLSLLVGVVLLWVVSVIPILGWLVSFVALLVGLGALVYHTYDVRGRTAEPIA